MISVIYNIILKSFFLFSSRLKIVIIHKNLLIFVLDNLFRKENCQYKFFRKKRLRIILKTFRQIKLVRFKTWVLTKGLSISILIFPHLLFPSGASHPEQDGREQGRPFLFRRFDDPGHHYQEISKKSHKIK